LIGLMIMENKQIYNKRKLDKIIAECLLEIDGGADVDDCLSLFPDLKTNEKREVSDALEMAVLVGHSYKNSQEADPSTRFQRVGKQEFLLAAREMGAEKDFKLSKPRISWQLKNAYALSAAAVAAVVFMAGSLVHYSTDSLPGNSLYAVKRMAESAQLAFTFDKDGKAKLHYELAQKRLLEANQLIRSTENDTGDVDIIVEDAKKSLSEASQIAKSTSSKSKTKLKDNIETLNKRIEEQSLKIASTKNDEKDAPNPANKKSDTASIGFPTIDETTSGSRVALAVSPQEANGVVDDKTQNNALGVESVNANDKQTPDSQPRDMELKNNHHRNLVPKDDKGQENGPSLADKALAAIDPFEVGSLRVSEKQFSPNGDGAKDAVRITVLGASSESYKIDIYHNSTKVTTVLDNSAKKDVSTLWGGVGSQNEKLPDGEYTVKVVDGLGQVAHQTAKVVIDTKAPRLTVVGPPNGIVTDNQTPQFIWSDNENVQNYFVHIAPGAKTNDKKRTLSNITNNFYEPAEKLAPGLWTWRVIAIDEAGNVGVSPYSELTIEPTGTNEEAKELR
jgi:hypothetical protein